MDDFFDIIKKMREYTAQPVFFASVMLIILYIGGLFGITGGDAKDFAPLLFGIAFCAVSVYYSSKSAKKSAAAVCLLAAADLSSAASTDSHLSFVALALLTFLFVLVMRRFELYYSFIICVLIALLFAALSSLLYERYTEALKSFAYAIRGRGAVFGALSNPFNLLFGDMLDKLFYHGYYSSISVQGGKFATGAVDIFKNSSVPQISVSRFLTGRYYASLFVPLGVFAALYKRLDSKMLFAFAASMVLSFVSGDERLFYFLTLVMSPIIYVGMLIIVYISYVTVSFIDIRIGFDNLPSLEQLFRNADKPAYLILTGIVVSVLSFFITRLVLEKFSIDVRDNTPHSVRPLVSSLGGKDNILRLKNSSVVVKNPNLIDILKLDCEISENTVLLSPDDIDKLRSIVE